MRNNPKLRLKVNQAAGRKKEKKGGKKEVSTRPKGSTLNSYNHQDFVSYLSEKYRLHAGDFVDGPDETISGQFVIVDTTSDELSLGWREAIRKEYRDAYIVLRRF
jgi:hypothetical protein